MIILYVICFVLFAIFFGWPWISSAAARRDLPSRWIDRLEEEWDREGDPPSKDWRW